MPPPLPRLMPRLVLMTVVALACRVPPLRMRLSAVAALGTAPRLASLLMISVPALIVVPPP